MIWAVLLLLLPLLAFLIKPVFFRSSHEETSHSEENLRLYQERCTELQQAELDDDTRTSLQRELDREFLASAAEDETSAGDAGDKSRWLLSLSLFVAASAATFLLYREWGAANELRATELLSKSASAELSIPERNELLERLTLAADNQPEQVEWRYLQARLLNADGEFARAAEVFADILVGLPEEATADRATTMTMLAQARFFAADQQVDDDQYELIQQALALMPDNRQAMGLAGIFAFELGQYRAAIGHWRDLWAGLPAGQEAAYLEQGIQRAAARLQEQNETADLSWMQRAQIKVLVDISADARAAATADDAIFVLAKAVDGPPMPLAAQKLALADLPQVITLSDAQAMMAGMNLSAYEQVTLVARLSKSGQPVAQPGDWQIEKTPVSHKEPELIKLVISQLVE
jgi:cytochrome c-type biogenesis protein CcmH